MAIHLILLFFQTFFSASGGGGKADLQVVVPKTVDFAFVPADSGLQYVNKISFQRVNASSDRLDFNIHGVNNTIWLKVNLDSILEAGKEWYAVIDNPLLDDVTLYLMEQRRVLATCRCGDKLSFSTRPIKARPLVFPIQIGENGGYHIYIRIDMGGRQTSPALLIMTPAYFYEWELNKRNELSGFYGFIAILFVINLYLGWIFKDGVFTWLSLFCITILLSR